MVKRTTKHCQPVAQGNRMDHLQSEDRGLHSAVARRLGHRSVGPYASDCY
jgi:hypothetical protein